MPGHARVHELTVCSIVSGLMRRVAFLAASVPFVSKGLLHIPKCSLCLLRAPRRCKTEHGDEERGCDAKVLSACEDSLPCVRVRLHALDRGVSVVRLLREVLVLDELWAFWLL